MQRHDMLHGLLRHQRCLHHGRYQHRVRHRRRPMCSMRHRTRVQTRCVQLRRDLHDRLLHERRLMPDAERQSVRSTGHGLRGMRRRSSLRRDRQVRVHRSFVRRRMLRRQRRMRASQRPRPRQMWQRRSRVRLVQRRSNVQRHDGRLRMHAHLVSHGLLRRKPLRAPHRTRRRSLRERRRRVRKVCNGASLHERRVQLRWRSLRRLLRERHLQHLARQDGVRRRGRRLRGMRRQPRMQPARQVRLHAELMSGRLLRRERRMPYERRRDVRRRRRLLREVRPGSRMHGGRQVRVHGRLVFDGVLQRNDPMHHRRRHHGVRLGGKAVRHLQPGDALRRQRVHLRRAIRVQGVLRQQRALSRHGRQNLRHRRRGMHRMRGRTSVQRHLVRVLGDELYQRMLQRQRMRDVPAANQGHVRLGHDVRFVRGRRSLQPDLRLLRMRSQRLHGLLRSQHQQVRAADGSEPGQMRQGGPHLRGVREFTKLRERRLRLRCRLVPRRLLRASLGDVRQHRSHHDLVRTQRGDLHDVRRWAAVHRSDVPMLDDRLRSGLLQRQRLPRLWGPTNDGVWPRHDLQSLRSW